MAKKKRRIWIWIVLGLLLLMIGLSVYNFKIKKDKSIEVKFGEIERRTILEQVSASGRIFPEKEIKISSDVSGEIVELYVIEGDSVVAGQLLAKIDPEAYESTVARGKAALSSSKSQLAISRSQKESSVAQKEQIMVQLENAETIHKRNKQLLEEGIVSQAEYEQSGTNVKNLTANLRSADASIRSAEESIKSAQYNIESSEATLEELKTNLRRTTIKAPASGIISLLNVEQGERVVGTIQMTGTELMRIANLSAMEVQVDVSENDIVRVSQNDKVNIEVDAYYGKEISGYVTEIASSASNLSSSSLSLNTDQVTNFIVKIRIDPTSYQNLVTEDLPYPFKPGMSASVDIYTEKRNDVLSVPIQAVTIKTDNEEEKYSSENEDYDEIVFLKSADTASIAIVTTGIQDDEYIQITSGLSEGDIIVVGPYSVISNKLKSGVSIKEESKDKKNKKKK